MEVELTVLVVVTGVENFLETKDHTHHWEEQQVAVRGLDYGTHPLPGWVVGPSLGTFLHFLCKPSELYFRNCIPSLLSSPTPSSKK